LSLPVWAFAVAPVVLVGGGILVARLAGWGWLTAIFAGAVGYLVVVDVAWMVTGAITTRRQLRRREQLRATLATARPREPARKGR
jgi:hypothetical protein